MPCYEQVYNYYATQRNSESTGIVTVVVEEKKKLRQALC